MLVGSFQRWEDEHIAHLNEVNAQAPPLVATYAGRMWLPRLYAMLFRSVSPVPLRLPSAAK